MKRSYLLIYLLIAFHISTMPGADLRDVLAHPENYNQRRVDLVGIARVPGYFYLFADVSAATKTDLSKALLVRKNNFAGNEYRELDRQWVRVTGVISSKPRHGWDPGTGVLLDRAQLLRDRPAPRIKDPMVIGVFQNATNQAVAVRLHPSSKTSYDEEFFLGPHEADKTPIYEGQAVVAELKGPDNVRLDKREAGKPIARCEIRFRQLLPADYEYSPEWSDKRTFYYRITRDRIELVPASEARDRNP